MLDKLRNLESEPTAPSPKCATVLEPRAIELERGFGQLRCAQQISTQCQKVGVLSAERRSCVATGGHHSFPHVAHCCLVCCYTSARAHLQLNSFALNNGCTNTIPSSIR